MQAECAGASRIGFAIEADLAAHATIAYTYWASGDDWSFTGPEGEVTVRVKPWMHTNNGDSCRAAPPPTA